MVAQRITAHASPLAIDHLQPSFRVSTQLEITHHAHENTRDFCISQIEEMILYLNLVIVVHNELDPSKYFANSLVRHALWTTSNLWRSNSLSVCNLQIWSQVVVVYPGSHHAYTTRNDDNSFSEVSKTPLSTKLLASINHSITLRTDWSNTFLAANDIISHFQPLNLPLILESNSSKYLIRLIFTVAYQVNWRQFYYWWLIKDDLDLLLVALSWEV